MRSFFAPLVKGLLLIAALGLASCGQQSAATGGADFEGLTLSISGPAFAEAQVFTIPNDSPKLSASIRESRVGLQLRRGGEPIFSESGQHRFDGMILRVSGGVGEHDQDHGVDNAWFSFSFNADQEVSQSASMDFDYSKGERQPVAVVIQALEDRTRVTGHFTARVQRTNHSSNHEFYNIEGRFNLRMDH